MYKKYFQATLIYYLRGFLETSHTEACFQEKCSAKTISLPLGFLLLFSIVDTLLWIKSRLYLAKIFLFSETLLCIYSFMQLPLSYCHHQRKDVISQTMYYDSATAATRKTYQITFSLGARHHSDNQARRQKKLVERSRQICLHFK